MNPADRTFKMSFRRNEPGYESARRSTMWNQRVPDRYPDIIVQASNDDDVISAMQMAARERLTVGVRSGGHSWSGNHVRDGGLLLDVSRLNRVAIDKASMRAIVGPGVQASEVITALMAQGLFFPVGHCLGVCLGGYLLQGGFGWNGRVLGPACESVIAIDYVDSEGVLRHASESENAEMLWAARGSGPGFFGVVLRFHLRLYRKPGFIGITTAVYPIDRLDEVFTWAHGIGPDVPSSVELNVMSGRKVSLMRGQGIEVLAPVFAESWSAARAATRFMKSRPRRAKAVTPLVPAPLGALYRGVMTHYPGRTQWAVDNMWTHAPIAELLPGLRRIAETMPTPPSHLLWLNWSPPARRPDMAFSVEDDTYLALYGGWNDPSDEPSASTWAQDRLSEMSHLASGCQLADENLGRRPARFITDEHMGRLDELRARTDANSRFHPWMGRI